MTDAGTFYTDHWKHIEDERLARYEQMFVWRAEQLRLLEPAGIAPGHRVVDLGCGPGFLSLAVAEIVGASGAVHGVDINARFVADATRRAHERGVVHATFHHVADAALPLDPRRSTLSSRKTCSNTCPICARRSPKPCACWRRAGGCTRSTATGVSSSSNRGARRPSIDSSLPRRPRFANPTSVANCPRHFTRRVCGHPRTHRADRRSQRRDVVGVAQHAQLHQDLRDAARRRSRRTVDGGRARRRRRNLHGVPAAVPRDGHAHLTTPLEEQPS